MKSPLRVAIQIAALFVLFVGAVFVGRSLPVPGQAEAAPIEPALPAKPLMGPNIAPCGGILQSAVITYPSPGRVQVKCSSPLPGIAQPYYAFKADDEAMASRILSVLNTAFVTGLPLDLYYVADAESGSWGCDPTSCRVLEGAMLVAP
ncbi:MAG: hypothetical protein NTY23_01225 [Chloroflexi bacterium]|nr:hypothetical protein [Chloroflexota bacterium]